MNKTQFMQLKVTFLLLLISTLGFAQNTITGVVYENNKPSSYIEVVLYDAASKPLTSTFTDEKGKFTLPTQKENYKVEGRLLGKILFTKEVMVDKNVDLGKIEIQTTQELTEVVVESRKKLIERKVDRLVFNVENSVLNTGADGLEVLSIAPGLLVDENKIEIIGKGIAEILINNRKTYLSGANLTNFIKNLRSENIIKIEIITSPSAKYDAQGGAGIINIVLKKNENEGLSGNVSTNASKGYFYHNKNGFTLNYCKNKFKITSDINNNNIKNRSLEKNTIYNQNSNIINSTDRSYVWNNLSTRINIEYEINSKETFGTILNYSISKILGNGITNTNTINNNTVKDLNYFNDNKNNINFLSYGFFYIKKFTDNKILNIEINKISNRDNNQSINNSNNLFFENINNSRNNKYNILTFEADLEFNYKTYDIEFGVKTTFINFNNNLNTNIIPNSTFDTKENINASFITIKKEINKQFSFSTGLRFEDTNTEIFSNNLKTNDLKYNNFFPNIDLMFKKNDNLTFTLNYNKRIYRPKYEDFNTNVFFYNGFLAFYGNNDLQSYLQDNYELNLSYKKLNISTYFSYSNGEFDQITFEENNIFYNKILNHLENYSYGININYSKNFYKKWNMSLNFNGNYNDVNSNLIKQQSFQGWSGYISLNNSIVLDKEKKWLVYANYFQTTFLYNGFTKMDPYSNLKMGVRYSTLNKRLNITLSSTDVLRNEFRQGTTILENSTQQFNNFYDTRRVSLTLNYFFGNSKVKKLSKNINNEENNRSQKTL